MTIGRKSKIAIAVVGVPVVLTSIWGMSFAAGLGDWMGNWGSTGIERGIRLPGDEVLPDAENMGTKAISINATPEEIWPWIAQMGVGRAGMYSYDWIDALVGSGDAVDGHSAERIHTELQDRAVGERMVLLSPTQRRRHAPDHALAWYARHRRW